MLCLLKLMPLLLYLTEWEQIHAARILGVFPMAAPSHYILGSRLMKELATRGHEVTVISHYKQELPLENYTEIHLTTVQDHTEKVNTLVLSHLYTSFVSQFERLSAATHQMTDDVLKHPNVQLLLTSNQKFDLIIIESFLTEALSGFAYHYQAPAVLLSTMGPNVWVNEYTKNPSLPSFVPQLISEYTDSMSFAQRINNFIMTMHIDIIHRYFNLPKQNEIFHKYFPNAPHISEVMRNSTSIILLNSHYGTGTAKSLVPNMIEIGGFHIEEPKELPNDLKTYLDNADNGVILVSMGTNLKSTNLPKQKLNILLEAFSRVPYKILWKFEDEYLPGKPDNVKIKKWMPQNDILAHRNLRLFITHGGLLSITEAIHYGVPVIGIPLFGDQYMNVATVEKLGMGKGLDLYYLTSEGLYETIQEVINDIRYRETAKERSRILNDQPLKPIDKAVFWVEYALRHKYTPHLQTGAVNLEWYQVLLLDVLAVLLGGTLILFYFTRVTLKKLFRIFTNKKYLQEKTKKQ